MPTKQRLTKQDITQAHIIDSTKEHNPLLDYLAKHHPQTISEERLNLDALSQALGFSPSSMQGYGLSFIGKPLANALYSTPTTKELKELDSKHSQNIIIKGDNLHALKLLKSAYDGKIKMIYIDPPYNTKNEKFIYDDNFVKEYQKLLIELDLLKLDSNGKVLEKSEVLHFLTNPSGDKAHSGWLSFMLPRLKLARDLLKDDGVIFISIDDNEQANLKILCDEIFGEENFCGQIIWLKGNAQNDADTIQTNHEYILCYAKNIESKPIYKIKQKVKEKAFKDEKTGRFYYEGAGLTTGGAGGTLNARPNLGFSIYYNPQTKDFFAKDDYDKELAKVSNDENEVYTSDYTFLEADYEIIRPPKKGVGLGRWTWALDKFNTFKSDILIRKNDKGDYVVLKKEWLDKKQVKQDEKGDYYAMVEKENPPKSFMDFVGSGKGIKELKEVIGDKVFNNPKNTILLKHLLKISTNTGGEI
ncbi:site-specific DNA-methyltransferase [Campylobacter upsaliensis]|nr:site-specific DNA-methyltransferase [Campylobacter upsaliensis]EAL3924591.1 site-specific DNA-methyltransferase [Campylobacter upsaliensis]